MKSEQKKPYSPPQITRVVLRREQVILSPCSLNPPGDASDSGNFHCLESGNCKNGSELKGAGDSGPNLS